MKGCPSELTKVLLTRQWKETDSLPQYTVYSIIPTTNVNHSSPLACGSGPSPGAAKCGGTKNSGESLGTEFGTAYASPDATLLERLLLQGQEECGSREWGVADPGVVMCSYIIQASLRSMAGVVHCWLVCRSRA